MTTTTTSDTEQAPALPNDQLNSLVAPIALYSDPLLAQTLAASTYPLEVIQLQQWMAKNPNLKDKALADAVSKQPWDPSIQGLVAIRTWLRAWRTIFNGRRTWEMHSWRSNLM
jgi:hypothetical protein